MGMNFRPTPISEKELQEPLMAAQMALAELSISQANSQQHNEMAIAELSIMIATGGIQNV